MPAVADVLERRGCRPGAVERVVCGAGPGSFTSLRIAGGDREGDRARGGVPAGAGVVARAGRRVAGAVRAGRYLAAIDALRGEQYVALFEVGSSGRSYGRSGRSGACRSAEVLERAAAHDAVAVEPGREGAAHVDPRAAAAAQARRPPATRRPLPIWRDGSRRTAGWPKRR